MHIFSGVWSVRCNGCSSCRSRGCCCVYNAKTCGSACGSCCTVTTVYAVRNVCGSSSCLVCNSNTCSVWCGRDFCGGTESVDTICTICSIRSVFDCCCGSSCFISNRNSCACGCLCNVCGRTISIAASVAFQLIQVERRGRSCACGLAPVEYLFHNVRIP